MMLRLGRLIAIQLLIVLGLIPFRSATAQDQSSHDHADHQSAVISGTATLPSDAEMQRAAAEMAEAALSFWNALSPELQAKCKFPFDDKQRFDWHFIPRDRKGITWNDMTSAQQALGHAFLASGLSSRGYRQAESIMSL